MDIIKIFAFGVHLESQVMGFKSKLLNIEISV